ncbi:MAG TPA: hypothetical protein VN963_00060 [bacterium]|nr:hypothetical protein [bacterium]
MRPKFLFMLIAFLGIAGCSSSPQPDLNINEVNLTVAVLQTKEVPSTASTGQNYTYCLGCLSNAFAEEVVLTSLPLDAVTVSAAGKNFKTTLSIVSGTVNSTINTQHTTVTVSSHS